MSKPMKIYIRTLSPIHIGCDEVYEPMAFLIDENMGKLTAFDPLDFFRSLDGRERLTLAGICKKGTIESLLELYKFMQNKKFNGHEVEVSKGFMGHYKKTLSIPLTNKRKIQQELNNLTISRTAFNLHTNQPYLPGSAIKGAIRTAYLNLLAAAKPVRISRERNSAKDLEKSLLDGGAFATDPFRMLKVSDFVPVGKVMTKIIYAVNEKKKTSKFEARGPYQILEAIEPGSLFKGWVTIEEPDEKAGIENPLTKQRIFNSLNHFYQKEKTREDQELAKINISVSSPAQNEGCLVRIGRHSGAESVTIEGYRDIKIMKEKGQKSESSKHGATTFWLASVESKPQAKENLKPFGWAELGEVTTEIENRFKEIEACWQNEQQKQEEPKSYDDKAKEPEEIKTTPEKLSQIAQSQDVNIKEIWDNATLTWNPGNQTLTANSGDKRADAKQKDLVPESLHKKLFEQRKPVTAKVTVERFGNAFRIVKIEPAK